MWEMGLHINLCSSLLTVSSAWSSAYSLYSRSSARPRCTLTSWDLGIFIQQWWPLVLVQFVIAKWSFRWHRGLHFDPPSSEKMAEAHVHVGQECFYFIWCMFMSEKKSCKVNYTVWVYLHASQHSMPSLPAWTFKLLALHHQQQYRYRRWKANLTAIPSSYPALASMWLSLS